MKLQFACLDGNEAAASVAYRLNEVIAIYPISPSSTMGEHVDAWAAERQPNLWGSVPHVIEMQSEGGAAGAIHGALQAGALATTFTASQGLLLMIPNMYKIAGELTPTVFHVTARTIATHALSIFGDHSDVMAIRATGWALLASCSVQEAHDFAAIAGAATLQARLPFVHFFDGFRTSHEVMKIETLDDALLGAMIDDQALRRHRQRALSPDHPVLRGTAQNPDIYFQSREAISPYYAACPAIVQATMDGFAALTGRSYHLFDFIGAADAERVIVLMGSGAEAVRETVAALNARGEKVGAVIVRLFRPFSVDDFIAALPPTVRSIAALDRTKEPGAAGEPLYQDLIVALQEGWRKLHAGAMPHVIGGRYGLSSKEFTPAMVKAIFDELASPAPKPHFTVGINDDVSHSSLPVDTAFCCEGEEGVRALFYGLGADGTVGANKNSIKIIGEQTKHYAQGYFVYDSKKSGSMTVSHLRFGPRPIHSTYLISRANFIACHSFAFLEQFDVLEAAQPGAVFLLNAPYTPETIWENLPQAVRRRIRELGLKLHLIDAQHVALEAGLGRRINTIMQTCFFAISGVLPQAKAIKFIKESIVKTYGTKGLKIVRMNNAAVDAALANLHRIEIPAQDDAEIVAVKDERGEVPDFVRRVTEPMIAGHGDSLPVSAFPADGTYPVSTSRWEKRNIALELPVWETSPCIQCGKCVLVCPHAALRTKIYEPALLERAPETFRSTAVRGKEFGEGNVYTIQVAPEDCTGCGVCVEACPVKDKQAEGRRAINMAPQPPLRAAERENWDFFLTLPEYDRTKLKLNSVKGVSLLQPLFEFSGACAGCGETPYIKLMTQLFGDRAMIANATGCSSIYGGNQPTTPYCQNEAGRGPAWSNSLLEDNAEFGLGFRLAIDKQEEFARELLERLAPQVGPVLADAILHADQTDEAGIQAQRARVEELKRELGAIAEEDARQLLAIADGLVRKSVWIVGGDGWAYDIGYGGLDHVLASGRDVNLLVLDTEVYSNTGGQACKSTPRGAVAKFAATGKGGMKKDLAQMAMNYGNVYVGTVAMGANDSQTVRTFLEAEAWPGPSLIIAYSHCIAHGIDMRHGFEQQKAAVESGHFPLLRYHPGRRELGENPLRLDSKAPSITMEEYAYNETRYKMLTLSDPQRAKELMADAQADARRRWKALEQQAAQPGEPIAEQRDVTGTGSAEEIKACDRSATSIPR